MTRCAIIPLAMLVAVASTGCGSSQDSVALGTFVGGWQGHARGLIVTRGGEGREWLSEGMSYPSPRRNFVFDIRSRLSHLEGTRHDATAIARITAARIGGQGAFTAAHPAPRVGETFRIRLHNGVLTSLLSGANYCSTGANWPKAVCGA
jgi:hypothetical protein